MEKKDLQTPLKHDPNASKWVDGLCDCCTDPGMCCIIICCDPILTGQLYERAVKKRLLQRIPMLSCVSISVFLWVCHGVGSILNGSVMPAAAAVGSVLSMIAGICIFLIVCTVRKAVRQRDGIPSECCGEAEDCCCSFWCNPCTQCQLWRHDQVKCSDYDLCSPTGSKIEAV